VLIDGDLQARQVSGGATVAAAAGGRSFHFIMTLTRLRCGLEPFLWSFQV
jgi:hypothetical protein